MSVVRLDSDQFDYYVHVTLYVLRNNILILCCHNIIMVVQNVYALDIR